MCPPTDAAEHIRRAVEAAELENLQAAAARLESGKSFDPAPRGSAPPAKCQVFVKSSIEAPVSDTSQRPSTTGTKALDDGELEEWLGGRDSNPDTMVQSHVSYRWTTSHQEGETTIIPANREKRQALGLRGNPGPRRESRRDRSRSRRRPATCSSGPGRSTSRVNKRRTSQGR
jgi:hypothetical protein